jgi:hypothetical protein
MTTSQRRDALRQFFAPERTYIINVLRSRSIPRTVHTYSSSSVSHYERGGGGGEGEQQEQQKINTGLINPINSLLPDQAINSTIS